MSVKYCISQDPLGSIDQYPDSEIPPNRAFWLFVKSYHLSTPKHSNSTLRLLKIKFCVDLDVMGSVDRWFPNLIS